MTYQQTIDYLFMQLPMFSKQGASAYKKDLTNTILLCNFLNNPQQKFKSIHIAGTNGKGSTSHMLAAILQTAGYKVGLYTSPHLQDFRERIKVDGTMCSQNFVVDFVQHIQPKIDEVKPSFFELTVAMAFEYFAQQNVDIAIIETGLGGRLDSTNIIKPTLSIITNIGYDHVNILGNTLQEIAYEKAGIIKPNTPVVIGEYLPQTKSIFIEKAQQENAPIYFAQDIYTVIKHHQQNNQLQVTLKKDDGNISNYSLDLSGIYQLKNIVTVIESCNQLYQLGYNINRENIVTALAATQRLTGLYGRWQILQNNPTIVADVAHNTDGIKQVLQQLSSCNYQYLHIIIGMVKDKDINAVLELLPQKAIYYFTNAHIERAMKKEDLQQLASSYQLQGDVYNNVNTAIATAQQNATTNDFILICGSIFLVGEIDTLINQQQHY